MKLKGRTAAAVLVLLASAGARADEPPEDLGFKAGGVPILTFAGWLDAGTADGVLSEFASLPNTQESWIGPWSHGQGHFADPFQPGRHHMTQAEHQQLNDRVYAFFDRYVKGDARPDGTRVLHYYTLNAGTWHTTTRWPVAGTRVHRLYFGAGHTLTQQPAARPGPKYSEK